MGPRQKQWQPIHVTIIAEFCKGGSTTTAAAAPSSDRTRTVQLFDGVNHECSRRMSYFSKRFAPFAAGARVALLRGVSAPPSMPSERRTSARGDRRKHSRSGRRAHDPHNSWRRVYLLFGAYAVYLSVRKLPATIRRLWRRQPILQ
jgi:hypothetical protein